MNTTKPQLRFGGKRAATRALCEAFGAIHRKASGARGLDPGWVNKLLSKQAMVQCIWLHIGAEKTGTTSLQYWLSANRELLALQGISFPKAPGNVNHVALSAYALDAGRGMEELRITCGASKFESVSAFRLNFENELLNEIETSDPSRIIFCNEHCSSRLSTIEEIERLRDLLSRFTDDIRIILYIREPAEFFASWYSTVIKSGGKSEFPRKPSPRLYNMADWLSMVRRWAEVFGRDAVTLRRYDRKHLFDGDVIADFCAITGLEYENSIKPQQKNESMGLKSLLFLREMNKILPRIENGKFNPQRGNIVDTLATFPCESRFNLSPVAANSIREYYADSYEILKNEYFPDDEGPLFDMKDVPIAEDADLSKEDIYAIARHLWVNRGRK
ncbi:hypothetical protein GR183_08330 [Stappia sp. GBMRC 2046]|uniref:Sulfotransferase family protein n=1 Tax=Stappia sediminis TaxID=2692190 RepID=A0A7X3LTP4_9HYPH|nr:hypothetical protein [Stappia sediminis]MXN64912.1 hypothetical protein [Stappia sediminis]